MSIYRLLFLQEAAGARRPAFSIALSCSDDEHAVRMVKDYADGRGMELWRDDQSLVRSWPPQKRDQPPAQPAKRGRLREKRSWTFPWRLSERATETARPQLARISRRLASLKAKSLVM